MRLSTFKKVMIAVAMSGLSACATPTPYGGADTGTFLKNYGYSENDLGNGVWRVRFSGTRATTVESVQTYWLYRCAGLALEKGYQGFKILSEVKFAQGARSTGMLIPVSDHSGTSYVPGWLEQFPEPALEADIELLKAPITPVLGKVFDAATLRAVLEPLVTKPCEGGNVCHHPHSYLRSSTYREELTGDRVNPGILSL